MLVCRPPPPELREDNCPPPTYLVEGVKALISALRTWLKREVSVGHSVLTVLSVYLHLTLPSITPVQMVIVTQSSPLFVLIYWMCVSGQQQTSFCSLPLSECGLLWLCR